MFGLISGALSGAFSRWNKRHHGEAVTAKDYHMLWAETTEAGTEPVLEIDSDKSEIAPAYRFVAHRMGDSEKWTVSKEKLVYDLEYAFAMGAFGMRNESGTGIDPYRYETVEDMGVLSEEEMLVLLRWADRTERSVGHISGVTQIDDPAEPVDPQLKLQAIIERAQKRGDSVHHCENGGVTTVRSFDGQSIVHMYGADGKIIAKFGPGLTMM